MHISVSKSSLHVPRAELKRVSGFHKFVNNLKSVFSAHTAPRLDKVTILAEDGRAKREWRSSEISDCLVPPRRGLRQRCEALEQTVRSLSGQAEADKINRDCPAGWHSQLVVREIKLTECLSLLRKERSDRLISFLQSQQIGMASETQGGCSFERWGVYEKSACDALFPASPELALAHRLEVFGKDPEGAGEGADERRGLVKKDLLRFVSNLAFPDMTRIDAMADTTKSVSLPAGTDQNPELAEVVKATKAFSRAALPVCTWLGAHGGESVSIGSKKHETALLLLDGLNSEIERIKSELRLSVK